MKTIKCTLPNASHKINDVDFASADGGGVVSGPVADDVAASFARIPGYEVSDVEDAPAEEGASKEPTPAASAKPHGAKK